jgi:hypothetical protein
MSLLGKPKDVDARQKAGHDGGEELPNFRVAAEQVR